MSNLFLKLKSRLNAAPSSTDMTQGEPWKLLTSFALPVLFSQIFQQLYNTADSLIVGRTLGMEALAAVSSSGTLIFLLVSFFNGTSMGAGVVVSKYFGAKDNDKISRAIHTNIVFSLLCGVVLTLVGVFLTPTFLVWMKTDPDVLPEAIEYFRYFFLGSLAMIMYNACRGIMSALGDSKRPLYYLIFSSLLNVALDVLFVAGFGWGVWSAAVATVLSQAASVVLCLLHLLVKDQIYSVQLKKLRIDKAMLLEILRYGLPAGVQNSVIAFANTIVQTQINSFGKYATAAYGTHGKIEGFAFLPIVSFNMAISTFISQNLGAQKYDRAKTGARFGIVSALLLAELIGIAMYLTMPQLASLFSRTPEVIALATRQARVITLFYCLLAYSHAVASVCRGAGKAFVPMFIMLGVWCVLRICYIAYVSHTFGELSYIYWAYPITWAISSVMYLIYYLKGDWIHGFD